MEILTPSTKSIARRTVYRGIAMRSRLEARAAQFLDSIPHVRWAYEPAAYADRTGQYLPDFETVGLLGDFPLFIEVKGAATAEQHGLILAAMARIWSSLPDAGLAVWTGATLEEGAPFDVVRAGRGPDQRVLRVCAICGGGVVLWGSDWSAVFGSVLCDQCEGRLAA